MSDSIDTPDTISAGHLKNALKMAVNDLDTITSLMIHSGRSIDDEDTRPEWLAFFGRAIDQVTQQLDDLMGRMA